jgi:glycosyltransferase involved in cell wall biosynthesis
MTRPARIVVLRGHQVTPWEVGQWEALPERFDVTLVETGSNWFDFDTSLPRRRVRALRDLLPPGRAGDALVRIPGERYLGLAGALRGADIVHAQELGYWYSAQAARLRTRLDFRLVLTVWETLPFRQAYRNVRTRPYRQTVLDATDRFLAVTERARAGLLLEGARAERITVCPPGVDVERFDVPPPDPPPRGHHVLSVGRLVWEKGHQDAIRALAALRRGVVEAGDAARSAELTIVGSGPEADRLRRHADELGVADAVTFVAFTRHEEMPRLYAGASCLVLASLATWSWEEQFGMVLAEAIGARLPIVASSSGAIPEVAGDAATYFAPGDWLGLARALRDGPLAGAPGARTSGGGDLRERYSVPAAAARLAGVYDDVLDRA